MAERISSIDAFRGTAIVLMAVGDFAAGVRWVPDALKHAPDPGFTVADLVAPMFLVAMAMTMGPSLLRKIDRYGRAGALGRMAERSLALIGIGAILTAGQAMGGPSDIILSWGVLQTIGAASLLALCLLEQPGWVRLMSAAVLFALFQFLSDHFFLATILTTLHNGLVGVLSWGAMLLVATAVADLYHRYPTYGARAMLLLGSGTSSIALGLFLSIWIPVSKNRASPSYMLVGLGICLLVFSLFHLLLEKRTAGLPLLRSIGRNPLALYIAHLLLLGLLKLPPWDGWYAGAPVWLTLIQAAAMASAILWLAALLERKGWILKL